MSPNMFSALSSAQPSFSFRLNFKNSERRLFIILIGSFKFQLETRDIKIEVSTYKVFKCEDFTPKSGNVSKTPSQTNFREKRKNVFIFYFCPNFVPKPLWSVDAPLGCARMHQSLIFKEFTTFLCQE